MPVHNYFMIVDGPRLLSCQHAEGEQRDEWMHGASHPSPGLRVGKAFYLTAELIRLIDEDTHAMASFLRLTWSGQITEVQHMGNVERALKPLLTPVVGYREVASCIGVSRRTIERMVRERSFPMPIKLSKNRVGWTADVVQAWLEERSRGVASVAVSNPDDLEPDVLDDHARELAAKALSKRTGQLVNPAAVTLHLGQRVRADEFVALETAEHRFQAEGLAQLSEIDAAVVAAFLLPSLRRGLTSVYPELARMLRSPDGLEVQFVLVSDALKLFELSARLCQRGARAPAGRTVVEHFAGFETGRAMLVSAQLFPSLRELIIAESENDKSLATFADDALFQQAVTAALDDTAWPEFQAKLAQEQSAANPSTADEMPA